MDNNHRPYKTIGDRINTLLADSDTSQKELSELLNVKPNIISYFCGGVRRPSIEQLITISTHFNVSVDYLLGLSDVKTTQADVRAVCDYTGLSEEAVNMLHTIASANSGLGWSPLDYFSDMLVNADPVMLGLHFSKIKEGAGFTINNLLEAAAQYDDLSELSYKEIKDMYQGMIDSNDLYDIERYRVEEIMRGYLDKIDARKINGEKWKELSRELNRLIYIKDNELQEEYLKNSRPE